MSDPRLEFLPSEIFALASALASNDDEASFRASTGRAYYAFISAARIVFGKRLDAGNQVHRNLPIWLRQRFSGQQLDNLVGDFGSLYSARISADYNLEKPYTLERAASNLERAQGLINALAAYSSEHAASEHPDEE